MKYKRYALSELAIIKYGKNQKKVLSEDGNIPIYGTGGLIGYGTTVLYDKPSVLIGRKGTIGKVKYVEHPFWTIDTLFYTIINTDIVTPKYLYYVMSLIDLNNYNEGTTIPSLRTETLNRLEFNIPSIEEQEIVLSCLNPIDEKIELNNAINNNLLQQIQLLCRSWLIDYAPFGYEQPATWSVVPLSLIADFVSGYSYKGAELADSDIAMATIKNFDRKGGFKLDGYKEIQPSAKLKPEQHAQLFDTLVAHTDLTQNAEVIGNAEPILSMSGYNDIVFSMDVVKVLPKEGVSRFLIAALLQDGRFKAHALGYVNGTTVLHLSKKALPEFELLLPPDLEELAPLANAVEAMYRKISDNIDESTHLANLRNTLLPRLMSGELYVSNIDL
jgi:type I restriction modification DNA specificity domain protein (fragment)